MPQHKIQKLIKVGDVVYSANGGKPLEITTINCGGFYAGGEFYSYDEVRILYFLTEAGYRQSLKR